MTVAEGNVGPIPGADNSPGKLRFDKTMALVATDAHGRYREAASRGRLFIAYAAPVTAPVIYTTAAGTGGPLLWNGTSNFNASILAVGISTSVVTTVAGGLGLTGNGGQTSAPTSTTAIDGQRSTLVGGGAGNINAYRVGTPTNAGNFLFPLLQVHTGALTVDTTGWCWMDVGG